MMTFYQSQVFIFRGLVLYVIFMNATLIAGQDDSAPDNVGCDKAMAVSKDIEPISSTTFGVSTADNFDLSFNQCGGTTFDVTTPGVWFSIEGTGATLKASTCTEPASNSTSSTNGSHRITIYEGTDCDSAICLDSSLNEDPECPYTYSTYIEWLAFPSEIYFILVHDQNNLETGGDFTLNITDVSPLPDNDSCENAEILTEETEVADESESRTKVGTLIGATEKKIQFECDNLLSTNSRLEAPVGVWYKVSALSSTGNGGTNNGFISLFMCSEPVGLDIAVFSGSPCVGADEVACQATGPAKQNFQCGSDSEIPVSVSWNATGGKEYYVLVYGDDQAIFGLTLLRGETTDGEQNESNPDSYALRLNFFSPIILLLFTSLL